MNKVIATALLAAAATVGSAPAAVADHHASGLRPGEQITIKCARYIARSDRVIWDRPMAVFLDDLRRIGYSPERAEAIGNRVCRDGALVNNAEGLAATMREILRTTPPTGR
ncbi:hypothetical protein [Jannaschia aquimarina]|uniref:Uncharacterized protein n=1 Tax=Jannaschia aquimarina TaxID=935700 RepID=A0A0D1D9C1_9RHOB|nr:hypothetical protein [Jannaschia aquimarina]KIT16493.1 hypothetical protein jaqu_17210 [Jannaschia aquimarina]SNT07252.1 hypothetical protein SAMN05421775_105125 [Jannaschia aquimarina]